KPVLLQLMPDLPTSSRPLVLQTAAITELISPIPQPVAKLSRELPTLLQSVPVIPALDLTA
ncbi:MAG: hypothetical protein EA359_13770, partial [Balneolaceae bacterium]